MPVALPEGSWALILGGSSGFGLATAHQLSRHGVHLCLVHRDRRGAMPRIQPEFDAIRERGVSLLAFNDDALSRERRSAILDELAPALGERGRVRLLLHSIAFGNLKLVAPEAKRRGDGARGPRARAGRRRGAARRGRRPPVRAGRGRPRRPDDAARVPGRRLHRGGGPRVRRSTRWARACSAGCRSSTAAGCSRTTRASSGLTSEGNEVAWKGYAAVAAAKVALESISRAIAVEMAPYGIRSNIVQAGVTDTPALRLIPGSAHLKAAARRGTPSAG